MSSPIEGLVGWISLGGTILGHLLGVELSGDRAQTQYRAMGTYDATHILKGRRNYEGSARTAFVCGTFLTLFKEDCVEYLDSFFPRGGECGPPPCEVGGTLSGTIAIKTWRLTGWEAETESAKIEEISFDLYNITWPSYVN